MELFDRLYGRLKLPRIIMRAISCPGIQRLREVRMANIPFIAFPAFANTSRFEHSLGVCYLAGVFAEKRNLNEKDKIELMLAALYHDVATPPFAHAVEEVLNSLYGFNHEQKLREVIIGLNSDLGLSRMQVFLGRSLKLHDICQSQEGREIGLDPIRIADIATGNRNEALGQLVCGTSIDLDNIDNVYRAASAIGVKPYSRGFCEDIVRSLVIHNGELMVEEGSGLLFNDWQKTRYMLYSEIFKSCSGFAMQTMLKQAIKLLATSSTNSSNIAFHESDWQLTDEELIHNRLVQHEESSEIIKDMRLGKLFHCRAFLEVAGNDIKQIVSSLPEIECMALNTISVDAFSGNGLRDGNCRFYANFFIDKRIRAIEYKVLFFNIERSFHDKYTTEMIPRLFLGLFTRGNFRWSRSEKNRFLRSLEDKFNELTFREIGNTNAYFQIMCGTKNDN